MDVVGKVCIVVVVGTMELSVETKVSDVVGKVCIVEVCATEVDWADVGSGVIHR